MVDITELQKKGFGSHGGLQHTVSDVEIKPLNKRVLVCRMRFGEVKTRGGIIMLDDTARDWAYIRDGVRCTQWEKSRKMSW